ncbi:MAG: serine hydrolase domain-containing protein [Atopobiaceae bacterium]
MWGLKQGRTRDIWIKAAAGVAAAAFIGAAAYAGGGWKPQKPVIPVSDDCWTEQRIEEGIEGPAVGTDAPNAVQDYFPDEPEFGPLSDNPTSDQTQDATEEGSSTAPSSGQKSYARYRKLDEYLEENFDAAGTPGIGVVVVDAAGIEYEKTMGDIGSDHDTMLIGSLTKSFTALSIMQLVEEGKIDLDTPAVEYCDTYDTPDDVTIRMLLNQTSGFGYYDSLAEATPGFMEGYFSYSNANYDLLGKIVEAVSGEAYDDYVEEHILAPLGMDDSSVSLEARAAVHAYRNYFGWNVADGFVHEDGDDSWGSWSSGYMATSTADMAKYLMMYLNQGTATATGGAQVLSASGIRQMFLSRAADPYSDAFYGMGWISFYWTDGELVLSHDGDVENGVARMMIFPERGIAIAVLGDAADAFGGNTAFYELADGVVAHVVGGEAEPVSASERIESHAEEDVWLVLFVILALAPLVRIRRWKRSLDVLPHDVALWRLVCLHALVPAGILCLPWIQGYKWRDVLTFMPDVSIVYIGSAAVLFLAGAAKLAFMLHHWRQEKKLLSA